MKKYVFLLLLYSCNNTDPSTIVEGERLFVKECAGCHNFSKSSIGPALGGITLTEKKDWIADFIRNPKKMVGKGDKRAVQLQEKYKIMMPSFEHLKEDDITNLIAFLDTHHAARTSSVNHGTPIADPIPGGVANPGLTVAVQLVTQFPRSADSSWMPLARITKMEADPLGRDFVVDLRGKLYRLDHGVPSIYMDIAKLRPNFIHEPRVATGFGSFAFHPDFASNGLLYTSHSEHAGSGKADFAFADSIHVAMQWVVTEWKVKDPHASTFSGEGREILRVNMITGMHGVQEIAFNPNAGKKDKDHGLLYICIGDGACVEEGHSELTHSTEKVWGSILRIDPAGRNSVNGHYGIPIDNPFVGDQHSGTVKEIYAYGFRNPHRITWSRDGKMFASNVGQTNIEAVCWIMPGHDYGWPIREGNFLLDPEGDLDNVYSLPADDSSYHITYPVAQYDHDEGKAICGGYPYEGSAVPALKGKFLFGDIVNGRLFYFRMADIVQGKPAAVSEWKISLDGKPVTLLGLCGGERTDLHFGKDARGELYLMTKTDGKIYRLISAN